MNRRKLMRIKIYYRSNLKMSNGKLAAQVSHAVLKLATEGNKSLQDLVNLPVVVLSLSDKKYFELYKNLDYDCYRVIDSGKTEVKPNTETCFCYIEE